MILLLPWYILCPSEGQCYRTFYCRKLRIFVISLIVYPGKLLQPIRKHYNILERLSRENTLAYLKNSKVTAVNSFITLAPDGPLNFKFHLI
jgi:hypothetical protein